MYLNKNVVERMMFKDRVQVNDIKEGDFKKSYQNWNHYKIVPKSKQLEYTLILKYCYNIDKVINTLDEVYPNIPKENPKRYDFKREVLGQVCYQFNNFPKYFTEVYGKPNLPEEYVKTFGEFYNFNTLVNYLKIKELNRCRYSDTYHNVKIIEDNQIKGHYLGFILNESLKELNFNCEYWEVVKV